MYPDHLTGNTLLKSSEKLSSQNYTDAFRELEMGVYAALETYSNVHRGSGQKSIVTTHLYEQARDIVKDYLKLNKSKYIVIFCTPGRLEESVGPKLARFQRILANLFPNLRFPGVVRVSLGIGNCEKDVDALIRALGAITEKPSPRKTDVRQQIKNFISDVTKRVYSPL